MLQKTVNQKLALGVPGDMSHDTPRIIDPYVVAGGSICKAYTLDTANPGSAILGGEGKFAGVAVNTKEYVINGLGASLDFRNGDIAQLATMGRIYMVLDTAVTIGMAAFYNTQTGVITAAESGTQVANSKEIPGSEFVLVNALAGETSILELNK